MWFPPFRDVEVTQQGSRRSPRVSPGPASISGSGEPEIRTRASPKAEPRASPTTAPVSPGLARGLHTPLPAKREHEDLADNQGVTTGRAGVTVADGDVLRREGP